MLCCLLMSHRKDGNGTGHQQPTALVGFGVFSEVVKKQARTWSLLCFYEDTENHQPARS